jgi:hypothetical protein
MSEQIKYLSDRALSDVRKSIATNLSRYRGDGFEDFAAEPGWDIPLGIEFDREKLNGLDLSKPQKVSEIDQANSRIVGEAFSGLDPSTANEERIWVRIAHVEAFEYSKARWLGADDDDALAKQVEDHVFARGQTAIRDDQAISRLWWNYEIARTCAPEDIDGALSLILRSADIRSNFVERIWMTSRQGIASAVLRFMRDDNWITDAEANFRNFMKSQNRFGGGIVFEALSDDEIDAFVGRCVVSAKSE